MRVQELPLQPEVAIGGSSDVADVSWNAPTMGVVMPTVPIGVSMHTWAVTACGGMSIGLKGALSAAEVFTLLNGYVALRSEKPEATKLPLPVAPLGPTSLLATMTGPVTSLTDRNDPTGTIVPWLFFTWSLRRSSAFWRKFPSAWTFTCHVRPNRLKSLMYSDPK